jgi:signal transduction histidine kinase
MPAERALRMTEREPMQTRVLLVDPDLDRRIVLHAFLETAGYMVSAVGSTENVLQACKQARPDLIVVGGDADVAQVEELPRAQSCAILACQPACSGADDASVEPPWADDCVQWPVSRSELLWRVRAVLRWRASGTSDRGQLTRLQLDEVLQLQRRREQTLALLVHDMKNPLAGVISNVEYLRGTLTDGASNDPELVSCMQDITQASRRLSGMVQSLLDVSQGEDGVLGLDVTCVDARALLEEAQSSCRARLRDKHLTLVVSCPDDNLALEADRELLLRLLANLLDNAISATPTGGTIELRVHARPDATELSVHDDGPGLPAADRECLQAGSPPERRKAHARRGLGLTACRVLAEAHGGTITVEEGVQRGATVCVRLPHPS